MDAGLVLGVSVGVGRSNRFVASYLMIFFDNAEKDRSAACQLVKGNFPSIQYIPMESRISTNPLEFFPNNANAPVNHLSYSVAFRL